MSETYTDKVVNIKVIGVGGAGNNVVNRMITSGIGGVEFVVVNTDRQDLNKSKCDNKLQIGEKLTGGMGAGSKPDIGKKSAEESRAAISKCLEGADMVFITAGMGGGTGTGAAPIIADLAHEAGILTVGVVTKPFKFEGANRMKQAEAGIAALSDKVDSLIIIPNDRLKYVTDQKITFANAFGIADDVLKQAVTSISELVGYSDRVIINLDFADVSSIMKNAGRAHMGVGIASGREKAEQAAMAAVASPLLETSINGATGVLINVTGAADLGLDDVACHGTLHKDGLAVVGVRQPVGAVGHRFYSELHIPACHSRCCSHHGSREKRPASEAFLKCGALLQTASTNDYFVLPVMSVLRPRPIRPRPMRTRPGRWRSMALVLPAGLSRRALVPGADLVTCGSG